MSVQDRIAAAKAIDDGHARLVAQIEAEQPEILSAADDWALTRALRTWAHKSIPRQTDHASLLEQDADFGIYGRTTAEIFEAFEQDRAGVLSGGAVYVLGRLYAVFGFQALLMNCGWPEDGQTRMAVTCEIQTPTGPMWVVQDVEFDNCLAALDGGPIDLLDVARLLSEGRADAILRLDGSPHERRRTILQKDQDVAADWTILPGAAPLRTLADGRRVYPADMTMRRYAHGAAESYDYLESKGLPRDLVYYFLMTFWLYPTESPEAVSLMEGLEALRTEAAFAAIAATTAAAKAGLSPWDVDETSPVIGKTFDLDAWRQYGLFVVRDFFSPETVAELTGAWNAFYQEVVKSGRDVGRGGLVPQDLSEEPPQVIMDIYRQPQLLDLVRSVYGNDIVLMQQRVLLKDSFHSAGVAPHQDCSYNRGGLEKMGVFVPLTVCEPANGGLHFILGTHKLGYLGDRGLVPFERMNGRTISTFPAVSPVVRPGDLIVMHHCTLHYSFTATSAAPRVYVNPYYQPATDGSYPNLISGEWRTDVLWHEHDIADVFLSASQMHKERIVELTR